MFFDLACKISVHYRSKIAIFDRKIVIKDK